MGPLVSATKTASEERAQNLSCTDPRRKNGTGRLGGVMRGVAVDKQNERLLGKPPLRRCSIKSTPGA